MVDDKNKKILPPNKIGALYKSKTLVSLTIFSILMMFILFIDAIFILLSIFKNGFIKKEVLSKKSNLGFDIEIIFRD